MSLRPVEFAVVTAAFGAALKGAVVQKISSTAPLSVELQLRQPGRTVRLVVCAEPEMARLCLGTARAAAAGQPSPFLLRLRKELVGMRLNSVEQTGAREVELGFLRPGHSRSLVLEASPPGALLLLAEGRRPLAAWGDQPRLPRPARPPAETQLPSRLPPTTDAFEVSSVVEALFSQKEASARAAERRRQRVQPLRRRVERLRRTIEKVTSEANRTEAAEQHRRLGELLRQNASFVPRGAKQVSLLEYTAQGARPVLVPLEPGLDAQAQAERHFQRYRRLSRGSAQASARLKELEAELGAAEAELAAARQAPDAQLLAEPETAAPAPARKAPRTHQPYRVFHARSGSASWLVGLDATTTP